MRACIGVVLAGLACACGENDEQPSPESGIDMLDPADPHYGKTYAEWAGEWVQFINDTAPPDCANPIMDTTGEHCALYQDPASDVFMLAGNYGGVSIRTECVVPANKALFFPLLGSSGDNAGVPQDMLLPDAEIKAFLESSFELMEEDSLKLEIDGHAIGDLERGAVDTAPYVIELEPEANIYTCQMVDGVEGEFAGYVAGYWAMLAPLEPGPHTISFGGTQSASPQGQKTTVDVTYELTVE